MATFLTTEDIVSHLHKIIEQAAGELILISPYIDADDETMNRLRDKAGKTAIHVVYRYKKSTKRPNLNPDDRAFFDSIGARVSSLKDLHTKCYLNQKEALVTSMNLYRYSQENNDEMGILVSKQDDSVLYEAIYREANRLGGATDELSTARKREPTRIYVGNLNFQASDQDLQELFSQHGEVAYAQIEIDRYSMRSRGFGFVEMPNGSEAAAAMSALKGQEYQGRQLSVNEVTERR